MLKIDFDFDYAMLWFTVAVVVVALAMVFWDVHYFVRVGFVILWGKLFQDRIKPDDTSTIYGMCTTNDLDIMFRHMNNARYVRDLDFARFHFYERTNIYGAILKAHGNAVQSACVIKYRRSIPLFTLYKITTKLIYWDEKALYLEQQFISLSDGFARAVALSKQSIIGINVPEVMAKFLGQEVTYRPTPPPDLDHFIACMDANSSRLRRKDD